MGNCHIFNKETAMKNYTRRNRNIGTSKQGNGQDNKFEVKDFFIEKLDDYTKQEVVIKDHTFLFITEKLQKGFQYSCSIDDIVNCLTIIPKCDYGDLKFIIFRQPKKKERTLCPVWGRLVYSYEFESQLYPAIIIEAFKEGDKLKWSKKISIIDRQEFDLLLKDEHNFIDKGKYYEATLELNAVRNTQLKRTIFHEVGHYVHYLTFVGRQELEDESYEEWESRYETFFSIPRREKEIFANRYAANYQ